MRSSLEIHHPECDQAGTLVVNLAFNSKVPVGFCRHSTYRTRMILLTRTYCITKQHKFTKNLQIVLILVFLYRELLFVNVTFMKSDARYGLKDDCHRCRSRLDRTIVGIT